MSYVDRDYSRSLLFWQQRLPYQSRDQIIAHIFVDDWNLHNWIDKGHPENNWTAYLRNRIQLSQLELDRRAELPPGAMPDESDIPF